MKPVLLLLLGYLVLPLTTHAEEFQLRDGSIVYGKLLRLVDGVDLVVDTAHMGEVTLEWDALERFSSTETVDIELFDGTRIEARLSLQEGRLQLDDDARRTLEPAEVFSISEIKLGFWDRADVYTDIGLNIILKDGKIWLHQPNMIWKLEGKFKEFVEGTKKYETTSSPGR